MPFRSGRFTGLEVVYDVTGTSGPDGNGISCGPPFEKPSGSESEGDRMADRVLEHVRGDLEVES